MELNHAVHLQWNTKQNFLFQLKSREIFYINEEAWMESSNKNCRLFMLYASSHMYIVCRSCLGSGDVLPSSSFMLFHSENQKKRVASFQLDSSSEALKLLFVLPHSLYKGSIQFHNWREIERKRGEWLWNESDSTAINLNFYYEISSFITSHRILHNAAAPILSWYIQIY